MDRRKDLLWLPAGAAVGFATSFVFGDLLPLPVDLYYGIHATIVFGFLWGYARATALDVRAILGRRLAWGLPLGLAGGLALMRGVLARPATPGLQGAELWWALLWRGLVYGTADGALLLAFPWLVVWRALEAGDDRAPARLRAAVVALPAILLVTTAYHLGYADFRSARIAQPNVGSAIGALPTLVAANPVASPISHVILHVTAVLHSPATDLFLPPHRDGSRGIRARGSKRRGLALDVHSSPAAGEPCEDVRDRMARRRGIARHAGPLLRSTEGATLTRTVGFRRAASGQTPCAAPTVVRP